MSDERKPRNFAELYPGRFLTAGILGDSRATVTIEEVRHEDLETEKGVERKAVVTFSGKSMGLVLCKLNGTCLRAMFGPIVRAEKQGDPDWIGRRVVLYGTDQIMPMPAKKRGDPVEPCIRLWGSPDIAADLAVTFAPPRRRPIQMLMRATGTPADDAAWAAWCAERDGRRRGGR